MMDISDVIAFGAFVISSISLWLNYKYSKKQDDVLLLEKKLNAMLIQKEEDERNNKIQADIKARYYQIGKNHRLKIWNDGSGLAKDVQIIAHAHSSLLDSEIEAKFPLDLESKQNVDLMAAVGFGAPSKHELKLCWLDGKGQVIHKTLTLTR
ncbi:hypothetical protein MTX11_03035 [Acinetobacter lwoffii]|uniref:hypothetical protein n=1 Tax=Acinetobacter lwoffii TaxID=28090 RepID=UPI001FB232A1|nr:hypothetical protein [Acinetobacter lwoffii]MCJ0926985.1 hypothetical protein [Acinetobacter lwoffii]